MEDLVGIKIVDKTFGIVGFITWGRIFNRVDPQPLLDIVTKHLSKFGIVAVESIEVCDTLQEISSLPYFYEALFEFSQRIIPEGKIYKDWQKNMSKALERGEGIYFLGLSPEQKAKAKGMGGTISHGFWYGD